MNLIFKCLGFIFLILLGHGIANARIESQGELRLESRIFTKDKYESTEDANFGLASRLEVKAEQGSLSERFRVFSRVDEKDPSRNQIFLEEGYVSWSKGAWFVRAGAQMFNWTATEAFHPADIVNSRNLDSDIENFEKVGEPAVGLSYDWNGWVTSVYYLPLFMEPRLPSATNRISFLSPGVSQGGRKVLERNNQFSQNDYVDQWAAVVEGSVGSADLSFHYVDHIDRNQPIPQLSIFPQPLVDLIFVPVRQSGGTYQQVVGPWLFKVEGAYRDFFRAQNPLYRRKDHGQVALGTEYGWTHESSGFDSTLIAEGQTYLGVTQSERAELGAFQKDVLVGYRLALNDVSSQEWMVTFLFDVERSHEYLSSLKYSRRLTDVWSLKTGVRYIDAPQKGLLPVGLEALNRAHQFYLNLSRYF